MLTIKAKGIVLKEIYLKESDKIIIVFLKGYGKMSVSAKGARKPNSKLMAGTAIFTYSDFVIYKGKKYFNLIQAENIESFYNIRNDIITLSYASYFVELTEKTILENVSCDEILLLLIKTLNVLSKNKINPKLISVIFEFKFLQLNGYMPEINNCVYCKKHINNKEIYFGNEGLLCSNCFKHISCIKISDTALYTLKYILSSNLNNLFNFNISDTALNQLNQISDIFIKSHLNLNLKTYDFLKEIENL